MDSSIDNNSTVSRDSWRRDASNEDKSASNSNRVPRYVPPARQGISYEQRNAQVSLFGSLWTK